MYLATFRGRRILKVHKLGPCCAGQRQGSLWPAEGARPKAVKGWAPAQQAAGPKAAAVAGTQLGCGWRPVALLL